MSFSSKNTWTLNDATAQHDGSLPVVSCSSNNALALNDATSHYDGS